MPHAAVNGIEIFYERHGEQDATPLLLIMGLGGQLVAWDPELIELLVARGYHVVAFDNRDVGLSTSFADTTEAIPYLVADMAADAAALVEHLGFERMHVLGVSMGGMIAQQLTIDHPHRVATLTSIMSTTGDPDVGQPTEEAMSALMSTFMTPVTDREGAVRQSLAVSEVIGSPGHLDEVRLRRRAEQSYDRNPDASGVLRQVMAITSSPSRTEGLRGVTAPTMVIHGDVDPLVTPSGGMRTAEAVPGAELHMVAGMGHDVPTFYWPELLDRLGAHTDRATTVTGS
jgi:pimeloyl-ACP methyl ester carboxylesterase